MRLFEIEQERNLHREIVRAEDPRAVIAQIYREYVLPTGYQPPKELSEDEIVDKIYNYYFSEYRHQTELTPKYSYWITGVNEEGGGKKYLWAFYFYPSLYPPGHDVDSTFGYKTEMDDTDLWVWRSWRKLINSANEASGGETDMIFRALYAIQNGVDINFEFYREMVNAVHQMNNALHDGIIRGAEQSGDARLSVIISVEEYLKMAGRLPQMLRKLVSNGWKQGRIPQEESVRLIEVIDNAWKDLLDWIDAPYIKVEKVDF